MCKLCLQHPQNGLSDIQIRTVPDLQINFGSNYITFLQLFVKKPFEDAKGFAREIRAKLFYGFPLAYD